MFRVLVYADAYQAVTADGPVLDYGIPGWCPHGRR
jgi:hypothetical protein